MPTDSTKIKYVYNSFKYYKEQNFVIAELQESFILFLTFEDLKCWIDNLNSVEYHDVFYKINKYGKDLITSKETVLNELAKELNIVRNDDIIKFSLNVEKSIQSLKEPYLFARDNFLGLTLLVGEILIHKYKVFHFGIECSDDGVTFYPNLISKQHDSIQFHVDLYESIFFSKMINNFLSYYIE